MNMPQHFWDAVNLCKKFPVPEEDWDDIRVTAAAGVNLPGAQVDDLT